MNNLFDYLKWRGDLSFQESPLNEVDNLIFCAFAYFKIENLVSYDEKIAIKDLYSKYENVEEDSLFKKNQNRLFEILSGCNRFENVLVTHYFNKIDQEKDMQIAGVTFILPNDTLFVAFKGTDESVTGWKEDFDLSYKQVIPAQTKAVAYLNEILTHTKKKVYVGGHSKGGNLAMYASLFCKEIDKIVQIYNNDGPGFNDSIIESENYKIRKEKIITYIPKSSIVGNLLNKDTKTIIVKSRQIGILQHDLYSWEVIANHFVYAKELSEETKKVCNTLNEIIEKIPKEQKQKIISFVCELLESWNVTDIEAMLEKLILPKTLLQKFNFHVEDFSILWKIVPIVIEILKKL